jgi:Protein of unknown function with PCYCGC motif
MNKEETKGSNHITPLALIAIVLVLLAIGTVGLIAYKERTEKQETVMTQKAPAVPEPPKQQKADADDSSDFHIPPFYENVENVSLQTTKDPATVSDPAQPAYFVAQKKPKLLAQLPCFCYCDRFGHTSLHDCFVTEHAEYCDVCMKEAIQADQMDDQGMSGPEIRDAIIAQYSPKAHNH